MEKDKIKAQTSLVDSRPFIKTAIQINQNFFLVCRKNKTTGKVFSVLVPKEKYLLFRKDRNDTYLQDLDKIAIDFLLKNIIPGEVRT